MEQARGIGRCKPLLTPDLLGHKEFPVKCIAFA